MTGLTDERHLRAQAWDHALESPDLAAGFEEITQQVTRGYLSLAEVGGFTDEELDSVYVGALRAVEAGQPDKALEMLSALILVEPRRLDFLRLAGLAAQQVGRADRAGQYYDLALAIDPEDALTLLYHGELQLLAGDVEGGVANLSRAATAAAADPALHLHAQRARALVDTYRQ